MFMRGIAIDTRLIYYHVVRVAERRNCWMRVYLASQRAQLYAATAMCCEQEVAQDTSWIRECLLVACLDARVVESKHTVS